MEVAYSESAKKLANDRRWWLEASNGDVKAGISLSINQTWKDIIVEMWELVTSDSGKAAQCRQRVVFAQSSSKQYAITVTNAPLRIPFKSLLLRPAELTGEKDSIDLTENDLNLMAHLIWRTQGLVEGGSALLV